jgi:hypothetical protein
MAKKYITKIEADRLEKVSIFQLKKENKLGMFPSKMEIINTKGNTEDIFSLTSTDCYFGGRRYWIRCHCGKRVGVIFKIGLSYACRYCHNLSYHSKNLKKSIRADSLLKIFDEWIKVQDLQRDIKRVTYGGAPTKKMREISHFYFKMSQLNLF